MDQENCKSSIFTNMKKKVISLARLHPKPYQFFITMIDALSQFALIY